MVAYHSLIHMTSTLVYLFVQFHTYSISLLEENSISPQIILWGRKKSKDYHLYFFFKLYKEHFEQMILFVTFLSAEDISYILLYIHLR